MISVNRFVIEMYQSKVEFIMRKYTEHAAALEMELKRLFSKPLGAFSPKKRCLGSRWNDGMHHDWKTSPETDSLID